MGRASALAVLTLTAALAACQTQAPEERGGGQVDQSSPDALATSVVEAARRGEDVTGYALADAGHGTICDHSSCKDLVSLGRATGVCIRLEGELTALVETANRDDSKDLMVYVTTDSNRSGFCSFHVSRYDGRW